MKKCEMKSEKKSQEIKVHSIESMASLDGEGIRCVVFLPGCPLRCACCHNPDTWTDKGAAYTYTPEELAAKINRFKPYFGEKGGVTYSGGEPLLSASAINEVNTYLTEYGISYAIDTSGCVPLTDEVKTAVDNASMIICDLKMWDDEHHKQFTGMDMKLVLAFLNYVTSIKKRLWIRTVIIPGINDTEEILDKYISIIRTFDPVEKYELLAFHTMGFHKYDKLSLPNPLINVPPMDKDRLHNLQKYIDGRFCVSL